MSTYATELAAISRVPVTLLVLTLDYCANVYGTAPCTGATASGPDLVSNGGFDTATTDWAGTDCSLASIAGGDVGNCLELTRTGGNIQKAKQTITGLTVGRTYLLTAKTKLGSGTDHQISIMLYDGATLKASQGGDATATWGGYSLRWVADVTSIDVTLARISNKAGTVLFDTVQFCQVIAPTACYNTYGTCQDKANYVKSTKDYKFTSCNAPLPFPGPRPYIESIRYLPTDISDNLTVSALTGVTLLDEPDTDVGIDPYYTLRTTIQGTFWRKFLARNKNYKGRPAKVYQGFLDIVEAEYLQRVDGVLQNITFDRGGSVTVEIKDLLASLADVETPEKLDVKLGAGLDATMTDISLTGDYTGLPASDFYVMISDEIIYVTTRTAEQCTGCVRGEFDTTADLHDPLDAVQLCRWYAPQSPYDILQTMLTTDGGIAAGSVDTTAYTTLKALDADMPLFSALLTEPTKLRDLYFEIIDLIDCKSWVGEDLKITISKNLPNYPGRAYTTITKDANIVEQSQEVDFNASARVSRLVVYWDKKPLGEDEKAASYKRINVSTDADGEGANSYNEIAEKKVWCRWIQTSYMDEDLVIEYIRRLGARMLRLYKDPGVLLSFAVEMKDSGIKTGAFCKITTDYISEADGSDMTGRVFQIVRREDAGHGAINLKALCYPKRRLAFIQDDTGAADWTAASDAQKEHGFIASSTSGYMSDGAEPYTIY